MDTGGVGGTGGQGGAIVIGDITATVRTDGPRASAVYLVSRAGAGGNGGGGDVIASGNDGGGGGGGGAITVGGTWDITTSGTQSHGIAAYSLGAPGGEGGDGGIFGPSGSGGSTGDSGAVTVDVDGTITLSGPDSYGIVAQSVAGHGGTGASDGGFVEFAASGGSAGDGGTVSVTNAATITSLGDGSTAIVAQSIGGGGGNGGDAYGIFYSESGSGSLGGHGSTVTVVNSGELILSGNDAHGIMAHSIGGTGGSGGIGDAGVAALGGGGANASNGGTVTVTNSGFIFTGHADGPKIASSDPVCGTGCSYGIQAYSIGGGGGSAGSTGAAISIGGDSGGGGNGGAVLVNNSAAIRTNLGSSPGIAALSVGGSGGSSHGTGGMHAIGGEGGGGGNGDTATVNHTAGSITTKGDDSDGVIVQSIGGSGGHGSDAISVSVDYSVAIGGGGGGGGDGSAATYDDGGNASYTITTAGDRSRGVFVQSVGGGGGNGGYATAISGAVGFDLTLAASGSGNTGGNGGKVDATVNGDIVTGGTHSAGLYAQSLGGGGGHAGADVVISAGAALASISLALGGTGGDGGDGGDVTVNAFGDITTAGDHSNALMAMSVGDGGGNAGITLGGSALAVMQLSVSVGGDGGGGGNGGNVEVNSSGNIISTGGAASKGILAQSVGGSGGNADVTAAVDGITAVSLDFGVGGSGGGGGDGGTVTVTAGTDISTVGEHSFGIQAQSVGGGGGNGATTISANISDGLGFRLATGGDGGGSGNGSTVTVTSTGAITTGGDNSYGIIAQSISNSGGSGGLAVAGTVVDLGNLTISTSGSGGVGGIGGDVTVANSGRITTGGDNSIAILAESIGGGGGSAVTAIAAPALSMANVKVSTGGNGGTGGTGGTVSVTNDGRLLTGGVYATGLQAQSIGGAGGNGAFAASGGLTAGRISGSVTVVNGGDGGSGGTGGDVIVDNTGNIATADFAARGIFAHSIGGDGGTGGAAFSAIGALSGSGGTFEVDFTTGGDGGNGAHSGLVDVTNTGAIATNGYLSSAIQAQSVGGNGGSGASSFMLLLTGSESLTANVTMTTGGKGGAGAIGGNVTIDNSGALITALGGSAGIYGQSIGGNGGEGGNAATFILNGDYGASSSMTFNVNKSIGGDGGTASHAGMVTITNSGDIATFGDTSDGIFAQSTGGGGGDGGSASALGFGVSTREVKGTVSINVRINVGGDSGASGDGDAVSVSNGGAIQTSGIASYGIYAQSVGGGGGNGGDGAAGKPSGSGTDPDTQLEAWASNKIVGDILSVVGSVNTVYSVYNLGTSLLTSWNFNIGGAEGAQGHGGAVTVDNTGSITTTGNSATAIFAQSVGGGGGSGGDGLGGFLSKSTVGGSGSGGGDGGDITVTNGSALTTSGDGAMGIYAQSVGGGGGSAGDVELGFRKAFDDLSFGIGFAGQRDAGAGGDGGVVNVTSTGDISTSGDFAHGIWAHSIGGAGGALGQENVLDETAFLFTGSAGDEGAGGAVTVVSSGDINLTGFGSVGIFAQSGGGEKTTDGGSLGGDVSITVTGDINSTGDNARGIIAQSVGGDGNGTITIEVGPDGAVSTVEAGYETIGILDGKNNVLTNYGTVRKLGESTATTYAVITKGGALTIDNYGLFVGPVSLDGDYVNTFTNYSGATLKSGLELDLGTKSGSIFTNSGTLMPGGSPSVSTTALTGDLVQTDTGTLAIDLNHANSVADLVTVSGTADLAGAVAVTIRDVESALPTGNSLTILTADGGVSNASQSALSVASTAVVDYGLSYPTAEKVVLEYTVDFAGNEVLSLPSDNLTAIAGHLQGGFEAGADEDYTKLLTTLANIPDIESYVEALHTLSPEIYADNEAMTLFSSEQFGDALLSCAQRDGQFRFTREGQCTWLAVQGRYTERDAGANSLGFDEEAYGLAGGVQVALDQNWTLGGGLAYENRVLEIDGLARSEGHQIQGGLVVKRRFGDTMISASVSGGYGWFDVERAIFDGSTAKGDQEIAFLAGQLRGAHTFDQGDWYLKPRLDLGLGYVSTSSFEESGAGAANLQVSGDDQFYASLQPAVEIGGEFKLEGGTLLRPRLAVGITHFLTSNAPAATASQQGGSAGVPDFTAVSDIDRTYLDLELGLDILTAGNWVVSASGFGRFSDNTRGYGGGLKLEIPF